MAALRVAVVGAGSISREFALQHFGPQTHTEVACVVDVDEDRAKVLAADVGSIQAGAAVTGDRKYKSKAVRQIGTPVPHFTGLTGSALDSCDVVYVGTTPASHLALVSQALAAGKHVILEKPISASGEDADAIVAAVESALADRGLHTSLNIGMRWNAALARMRNELADQRLGALRGGSLRLHFQTWPRAWQRQAWCARRAEGGPLREVGTHFLFGLHELFGHGCVRRVMASVVFPDGSEGSAAEQSVEGVLELEAGCRGSEGPPVRIQLSVRTTGQLDLQAAGRDLYELVVDGELGSLKLFDFTSLEDGDGKTLVSEAAYGRQECVQELVAAVRGSEAVGASRMVTAREARSAQRVLDAILTSSGSWISVSYD
ncbi:unnamed protein product [Polarella glacialis]|uniref:Gfo/Idh/MocA-like oxidoreductase N-terminal domain-containing protein n=1 Tax=Polarella glacialis TaxID=89957 RepID=A0A813EK48_POLGL|nr:unnamed protein product [Polarella glacialis]